MKHPISVLFGMVMLIASSVAGAMPFSNLFVLGDSLSDTGNLFLATGASPLFPEPMPAAEHYDQGRFSNGPAYVELLAGQLGLEARPSFAGGTNYAVGGARSRYHRFDLQPNGEPPAGPDPMFFPFSLLGQEQRFQADVGPNLDPDALYVVWAGSNDLYEVLTLFEHDGGDTTRANLRLQEAVTDIASIIGRLVDAGAETLLVPKVPDIGLTPEMVAKGPMAQAIATGYSQALNELMDGMLADLSANIIRFDTFEFLRAAVMDPERYGFDNVTEPCLDNFFVAGPIDPSRPVSTCDDPEQYLFWDIIHPSAATHTLLAGAMRRAVPEPDLLFLLGAGLALTWLVWWFRNRRLQ
ncbi:MAG TPA: G-D-S-L family lipolytic protein [Sedimenticola sp.]|nr:G-D-S-L family lipolytic protein [Sedimenticola sp.]